MGQSKQCSLDPTHEALLNLERRNLDRSDHLEEASRILGINFATLQNGTLMLQNEPSTFLSNLHAPRHEWVLRWLAKRLRADNDKRYALDVQTWVLFRYLVTAVPPRSVARIITDYHLLESLESALQCVFERFAIERLFALTVNDGSTKAASSRKRKRSPELETGAATSPSLRLDRNALYILQATLGGLSSCLALAQGDTFDVDTSTQSVRTALQANFEFAAILLGRALMAATVIICSEDPQFDQSQGAPNTLVLKPLLHLWDFRDQHSNEVAGEASNLAFTKQCLIPALAVLKKLQGHTSSAASSINVIRHLQKLIVLHVIFPLRGNFHVVKAAVDQMQNASHPSSIFTSLQSTLDFGSPDKLKNAMFLLPIFLDTAIKATPLNNSRRRQHEIPWIQSLFMSLFNLGGNLSAGAEGNACRVEQASCLEGMLKVLILHHVSIPIRALVDIASSPSSGLLQENLAPNWALLAHIIRLDVNTFLPNTGLKESSRLLDALIKSLSSLENCGQIHKADVVIPLIEGFGRARDMFTLFELIRRELVNKFEAPLEGSDKTARGHGSATVWEDKDILSTLTSTMKDVPIPLIDTEFSRYFKDLEGYELARDKGRIYASTTVLDTLLVMESNLFYSHPKTLNFVEKLPSAIVSILSKDSSEIPWQVPLWRLLWHAALIIDQHDRNLQSLAWESITPLALQISSNALSSERALTREALTAAANAFRLLVLLAKSSAKVGYLQRALSTLSQSLLKLSNRSGLVPMDKAPQTSMTVLDIGNDVDFTVACTSTLLLFPESLLLVSQQCFLFFQALLQCADPEKQPFGSNIRASSTPFTKLFHGFVTHRNILTERELLGQLFEAILARIERDEGLTDFLVKILSELPLDFLSRRRRANLCDVVSSDCTGAATNFGDQSAQKISMRLDLLMKLVITADNNANILKNPESLWTIVSKCSFFDPNYLINEELLTRQFRDLSENVWKRVIASPDRRHRFLSANLKIFSSFTAQPPTHNPGHSLPYWECLRAFMELLRTSPDLVSGARLEEQTSGIFDTWFVHLNKKLDLLTAKAQDPNELRDTYYPYLWTLDALSSIQDRCQIDGWLKNSLMNMEQNITKSRSSKSICLKILLAIESFRYRARIQRESRNLKENEAKLRNVRESFIRILENEPSDFDFKLRSRQDLRYQASMIHRIAYSLSQAELSQFLHDLEDHAKHYQNADQERLVIMIVAAINSLGQSISRQRPEAQYLISLVTVLQDTLNNSETFDSFVLSCDCIICLLKTQPELITQFVFDNTLSAIVMCTATAGPKSTSSDLNSSVIYIRLTTLATVLILHYRKKLGGRFHLLLPVLQNLLRCLFISYESVSGSKTSSQPRIQHPPWLTSSNLLPRAATSLTRLFTTITHPTPTSVSTRRSRSHNALTDPVPRARRTASQYLQYIIIEYCACRLQGRLDPDVKTALMPGLFAIIEIMDDETRKGMNGLMSRQLREVFRGLWAEWGVSRGRLPGGSN